MLFQFKQSRLFEWVSAGMMIGVAAVVMFDPRALSHGAMFLVGRSIGAVPLDSVLILFGTTRVVALILNGMSHTWGPHMRAVGALVAALIWAQMALALTLWSLHGDYFSIAVPVYTLLVVGEIVSSHGAMRDASSSTIP